MYTFAFLKQPVGRSRYALMTNEHGVVIEDGVCARFADNHFYVTATTSGVVRIYQQMLKWNAQWRLNVDIANVTAVISAVNMAGPGSRKVLEKVCPSSAPNHWPLEGHLLLKGNDISGHVTSCEYSQTLDKIIG